MSFEFSRSGQLTVLEYIAHSTQSGRPHTEMLIGSCERSRHAEETGSSLLNQFHNEAYDYAYDYNLLDNCS